MKNVAAVVLSAALLLTCTACTLPMAQSAAATAPSTTETTQTTPSTVPTAAPTAAPTVAATEVSTQETLAKDDVPVRVTSEDKLLVIELPNQRWAELYSDEHTILFSDGDCAITVDIYKDRDTLPTVPLSDENHKLIFTTTLSTNGYVLFITGYAHEETDFAAISTAIGSIRIDKNEFAKAGDPPEVRSYDIQERNYDAWVTATALNVRSASGTDASILASLPKGTKVTVTGEVLESGRYIGWSRIRMSNGATGFVASQFLTSSKPQPQPGKTGTSKQLWSEYGTLYIVYEYTDGTWKTDDGVTYWPSTFSTWTNSAGRILYDYDPTSPAVDPTRTGTTVRLWDSNGVSFIVYQYTDGSWKDDYDMTFTASTFSTWTNAVGKIFYDYDPTEQPVTEPAAPTRTGTSVQLWDNTGASCAVYEYTDGSWKDSNGTAYWPDGFSTWGCSNGRTYYDYDPTYVEPTTEPVTPAVDWKDTFEKSLYAHDGMIACWYTYLGDGYYEVFCQDPNNPDATGTVRVNAYTGSWEWV